MTASIRNDGWQPTYGEWHLFLYEPHNKGTGLRVRMWVRVS